MKRDCSCLRARHEHGTRQAYQRDECRCEPCRAAHARHALDRRRRHAEQAWNGGSDWTDPARTILQLRALAADGWTLGDLAPLLCMTRSGVHMIRTEQRSRMLRATATRVEAVYQRLDVPVMTAQRRKARSHALRLGWLPSIALETPDPMDHKFYTRSVDEIAVERAVNGERVQLTRAELSTAVAMLNAKGISANEIATRLGLTDRTVQRHRSKGRAA